MAYQTNKQPVEENNRQFGRGLYGQPDQNQIDKKVAQQQSYKQQLQRQIFQKEERKRLQQEKIRREDEKFMKEIQQINRVQNERKQMEKEKKNKRMQDQNLANMANFNNQKQQKNNQNSRVPIGILNVNIQEQVPEKPFKAQQDFNYEQKYRNLLSMQKKRPYIYQDNEQIGQYYEQRIKRHKQQLNQKLDELFHHINSTKDNIRVDEEIEKIKKKLKSKKAPFSVDLGNSHVSQQLEHENRFFNIPKKNYEVYQSTEEKSRVLDYQSKSKFTVNKSKSKAKLLKSNDLYSLPESNIEYEEEKEKERKWGVSPGKDNFLSNREAIDYQAENVLKKIDDYLDKLKS